MEEYIKLLKKLAKELAKEQSLTEDKALSIIRKWLNPFDNKPKDKFNPTLN